jgi:hypothetical protein
MAEKHVVPLDPADGLGTAALPFGHVATRQMQVSQEASAPAAQAGCVVVYADENGDLWRRLPNGDIEAVGGGEVESVNGQTGVVVLAAADVGAEESGAVASHVGETDPHTQYEETAAKGQPGGYAELDATGKVPSTQIPAVAITDFLGEVATEAAMLALDGEKGDWCIRTDLGAALILIEDGGDDLSDWKQMPSPTAPVLSVNGQTGAVSLDAEDVGADTTGSAAAAEAAAIAASDPAGSAATVQADLDAQRTAQKEPSGFESPEAVSVAYSYTNRTFAFTQSGGVVVWVDGERFVKTSPWVSPAHTDAPGRYWLTVDDSGDFAWATSVWAFSAVQAGYVAYQNASLNGKTVPMRECHGLMQWQGHQELHERIGTYIRSGGALVPGSFALQPASPTDADNAPDIAEAVLADEDLPTTLPQLLASASAYAHAWSAAGGTVAMDMSFSPYIFKNPITNYPPYYPASGTPTEISNNRYMNYYLLEIPVTTDATGQQWRFVWLQPWTEYSSLVGAQAEEIAAFPAYAALQASIPEFVPYVRVTMRTSNTYGSTGKCRFEAVTYLTGGRAAPIYISPGGGDVVGPVGAVDNALCRFDGTTGKLLQDSLVSVSDAGVVSLPVGAVGAPALVFDANTTTGIFAPASDTVAISTSGAERARVFADGGVQIGGTISTSPGAGVTRIASTGGTVASFTNTACTLTQRAATTGSPSALKVSGGAHTGLTAGTEVPGVEFDLAQVKTHAAGAITTQREIICRGSTHAFDSASTITTAATLAIASIPVAGANCTITERLALWVQAGLTKLAGGLAFVSGAFKSTINTLTLTADRTISTPDADGTVTLNEAANTFTGANTFRNALPIKVENAANQDAILLTGRAGGTSGHTLTVVPGALSSPRTITLPNLTGTLVTSNNTHTISGPWTFQNSAGVRAQQAANQDAVVINGRAGGSGGYEVSVVPDTLSADRTATLPNKSGTVAMVADIAATKLDDFAAPDDNTDLNATTGAHGLLPKLGGGTTDFLRADGAWAPPAGGAAAPKNVAINGKMDFAQRGTSFTIGQTGGSYTLDRYYAECNHDAGNITITQDTAVPNGEFANSIKLTNSAGNDTSIAAGQYFDFQQRIEGYSVKPLTTSSVTISFWVRSSKTGTYCVSLRNAGADRSYVAEYTITAANTWEKKTITIDLSAVSGGTWNYTNGVGLYLTFALAAGSTYQGAAGSWQSTNIFATLNQVNWLNETNTFYLTGLQVEEGAAANDFEHRPYDEEKRLCQRYYAKSGGGFTDAITFFGAGTASSNFIASQVLPVEMRNAPTLSYANESASYFDTTTTTYVSSAAGFSAYRNCTATTGVTYWSSSWTADAEL